MPKMIFVQAFDRAVSCTRRHENRLQGQTHAFPSFTKAKWIKQEKDCMERKKGNSEPDRN